MNNWFSPSSFFIKLIIRFVVIVYTESKLSYCIAFVMFLKGHTTASDRSNFTSNETENYTSPIPHIAAIFLQTATAQGIAGTLAFASLLLTSYHASISCSLSASHCMDSSLAVFK